MWKKAHSNVICGSSKLEIIQMSISDRTDKQIDLATQFIVQQYEWIIYNYTRHYRWSELKEAEHERAFINDSINIKYKRKILNLCK